MIARSLLGLFLCLVAIPVSGEDGFRPLLNGQDLSGWVLVNTPPQTWSMQDACWSAQESRSARSAPRRCTRTSSWRSNGGTWSRGQRRNLRLGR